MDGGDLHQVARWQHPGAARGLQGRLLRSSELYVVFVVRGAIGSKWTDGPLQQTKEFSDLVGIDTDKEKVAGIVWFGFAKGGLGEAKPKERRKGYDEVLDVLP